MSEMPPELSRLALQLARGQAGLRQSSERISAHYRQSGASHRVIAGEQEALAYALSRMPATYAAVSRVLEELRARAPDFRPDRLLDAGAGPGTATWAMAGAFPELREARLLDHNRAFLELARQLGQGFDLLLLTEAESLLGKRTEVRDAHDRYAAVTCAYALTEFDDDAVIGVAESLWARTAGVLVIVEPGRPRDYERLMAVRERLVGLGGRVLAPCPHGQPCPLVAPDWCHFSVRLSRSREHMRMKGGTLGYEDEKFSYLIVARDGIGAPAPARVIRQPAENKFSVTLALCTPKGAEARVVPSRDRPAFKAAKRLGWGDALEADEAGTAPSRPPP